MYALEDMCAARVPVLSQPTRGRSFASNEFRPHLFELVLACQFMKLLTSRSARVVSSAPMPIES